jgi:xylitol oxidase
MKRGIGEPTPPWINSITILGGNIDRHAPTTNRAGNVTLHAASTHRPESIDSLRRLVAGSEHIRALGCGHSFSGIVDTTGDLILLDALPKTLSIDSVNSTVTVTSAMRYTDLAGELHRAGFALANMASIPDVSITGACATGTHGSGDDQCVLAASVSAMRLVAADGDLMELRRDLSRGTFLGSVVALGALGIVTELTLDIEPAYEMSQRVHLGVSLDEIQDQLDDVFSAGYSVSAFTDWCSDEANVWVKQRVDRPVSTWTAGRQAQIEVHPIPGMSPQLCIKQLGIVGPWHERLVHFRPRTADQVGRELQSEVFLPRDLARQAVRALREIGNFLRPALLVSEVRTLRADDLWLSPAYGRDSVAFHFTWKRNEPEVLQALALIEQRLKPLGPRPHWGKLTTLTPREVVTAYERASDFERLTAEYDPTFKFRNEFVNGLFPTG